MWEGESKVNYDFMQKNRKIHVEGWTNRTNKRGGHEGSYCLGCDCDFSFFGERVHMVIEKAASMESESFIEI